MAAPILAPLTEGELVELLGQIADLRELAWRFREGRGGVPAWFTVDLYCAIVRLERGAELVALKVRKARIAKP